MPHHQTTTIDTDTLMSFVFRAVDEVGAALNCALVVMGDRLGYYKALADGGPMTAAALAAATGTAEPYAREWLNAQAAGAFVTYEPADGTYALPPGARIALTDESSPAFLPGFFQIALGTIRDSDRILAAAPDGDGVGWHDHNTDVHDGCERFFRPGYNANLVAEWLPAVDGLVDKLTAGRPSPTSAAATAPRPCSWPRPTRPRASSAPTTTRPRSAPPSSGPPRPAWRTGSSSRWPRHPRSAAPATTW